MNRLLLYLRDYKLLQMIYTFLHREKVKHNEEPYKQYGIKKFLFSSVSSKDFRHLPQKDPWLDDADENKVTEKITTLSLPSEIKNNCFIGRKTAI